VNLGAVALDPVGYSPHPLHASERIWTETNCYIDLWIELLHALGCDPLAAAGFTLSADFNGDQWAFLKFPPEDLRAVFAIDVAEMNVWRPVIDHVSDQIARGRLLTVEADSWFLPDTHGVSYQIAHTKSTIVPWGVDRVGRTMTYFHNAGFFGLEGDDFDGVFRLGDYADPAALVPYVEIIDLEQLQPNGTGTDIAIDLARAHLRRRPLTNPISRLSERVYADLDWLAAGDLEAFHLYAFGTCRQCGAGAELAASYVDWLAGRLEADLGGIAEDFQVIAAGAKAVQFGLARVARGRSAELHGTFSDMEAAWERAMDGLSSALLG